MARSGEKFPGGKGKGTGTGGGRGSGPGGGGGRGPAGVGGGGAGADGERWRQRGLTLGADRVLWGEGLRGWGEVGDNAGSWKRKWGTGGEMGRG